MHINTVNITLDEYTALKEASKAADKLSEMLAETIAPLAEYKKMCAWLAMDEEARKQFGWYLEFIGDKPSKGGMTMNEINEFADQVKRDLVTPAKPSKDCLTAMAEVKWNDCPKAVE